MMMTMMIFLKKWKPTQTNESTFSRKLNMKTTKKEYTRPEISKNNVNAPFVFLLWDKVRKVPLIIGKVLDPMIQHYTAYPIPQGPYEVSR